MKYVKQFFVILFISLIGEILKYLIPFPIPASIYGMVILFICLMKGVIKLDEVKETGKFLIEIMPIMFIPAGVGLITSWNNLQSILVPACLITAITLITVMAVTGMLSQKIIRKERDSSNE